MDATSEVSRLERVRSGAGDKADIDTVGMALGVDRLAMALLGADSLADVLPFVLELDADA